jgi:hypothetical protein
MADFAIPETRYARSGEVNIAYQVVGEGPIDVLVVPGAISHLEFIYELPVPVGNSILLATDIESGDAPALCERFVA